MKFKIDRSDELWYTLEIKDNCVEITHVNMWIGDEDFSDLIPIPVYNHMMEFTKEDFIYEGLTYKHDRFEYFRKGRQERINFVDIFKGRTNTHKFYQVSSLMPTEVI